MNLKLLDVGRNTLIKQQHSKQALVATRFDWALDHRGVSDATSEKQKRSIWAHYYFHAGEKRFSVSGQVEFGPELFIRCEVWKQYLNEYFVWGQKTTKKYSKPLFRSLQPA